MRLLVKLVSLYDSPYWNIRNTDLQGFVYSLLRGTDFEKKHDENGFKYFCFSNIYPPTPYKQGGSKSLIISSVDSDLIQTFYESLEKKDTVHINNLFFKVVGVEWIPYKSDYKGFITGTPIALYKNKYDNHFFTFKQEQDFDFFFRRLKENLLKKYNSYYGKEYSTDEPLFTQYTYFKEVAHSLRHRKYSFLVIGSLWKFLKPNPLIHPSVYNFLYDVGLGEKNSLGYGFVNKVI